MCATLDEVEKMILFIGYVRFLNFIKTVTDRIDRKRYMRYRYN